MWERYKSSIYKIIGFFSILVFYCLGIPLAWAEEVPEITSFKPTSGFSAGGAEIIIKGQHFDNIAQVYFGDHLADGVTVVNSQTIKVVSPKNIVGDVEIHLENPEGDRFTSSSQFTYISTPVISGLFSSSDDSQPIEKISIEGDEEIEIKGSEFIDGCRVVFNPVLSREKTEAAEEDTCIFVRNEGKTDIEDGIYYLVSAIEGEELVLVDAETLIVQTPAGEIFSRGIMVINPDGGASSIYENIVYDFPELDIPTAVRAEIVEDLEGEASFIRVNWDSVEGVSQYEVFVSVEGDDPEYLGSTQRTSFIYYEIEDDTEYEFLVKAVGEYNASQLSEESRSYSTDELADNDEDNGINEYSESFRSGDCAMIKIGTRDYDDDGIIKIDLTRGNLAGSREAVIIIPSKVVASSRAENVEIIAMDWILRFNPQAFMQDSIHKNRKEADSGIRFRIIPYSGDLQWGVRNLSATYLLEAQVFTGKYIREVDYLAENIFINLDYDYNKARIRRLEKPAMYRYNHFSQQWESSYYWQNREAGGLMPINRLGIYTIMGKRVHEF